ncbi:low-density lipoprotein receptor class A domain-containing protein 2 isoform X3 [Syngnathus scovelli]|uniref:low-density lipoprotein receptor class A domain-containing protein 2 isoform X3 n=1 Tax=Syngnathus scovelli TaxID=161590 RepID=UPI002110665E|nr:low-density lipoprotein receptor class A domain-containing protein 2 isoform X3 [Syngnathus scovelli]
MDVSRGRLVTLLLCFLSLHGSATIDTVNVVDFCGQTIRGDGMIINSHQESKNLLRVAPLSPAPLLALDAKVEPTSGESSGGDPCHAGSFVQFYDGRDRSSPLLGPPLCGKSPPRPVLSTGNYLTLRLVTRGTQPRVDFVGDFTSFRLGFNHSLCSSEPYFTCRNGKCIPLSLVCDDKGIDNCGDGSDLEENLTTGCKAGQLVAAEQPATATPPPPPPPPPSFVNSPTVPTHFNCGIPHSTPSYESVSDSPASVSLWVLFMIVGGLVGSAVLCWCCWSPGWFLWRISIFRFLSRCNSPCASCQLCVNSCASSKEQRLAKVSPQPPPNGVLVTDADERLSAAAAAGF